MYLVLHPSTPYSGPKTDSIQTTSECAEQGSSESCSKAHMHEDEEMIIMSIRATDVTSGLGRSLVTKPSNEASLRRLPAGFYATVYHSNLEWKTEIKRPSANNDVVKWDGPIPIPSDLSATICLEVYASFEHQPMLDAGEQLRKVMITVRQLLDAPLIRFPMVGDIVSPCSSILVTVGPHKCEIRDLPPRRWALGPREPTPQPGSELEDTTDYGHMTLPQRSKPATPLRRRYVASRARLGANSQRQSHTSERPFACSIPGCVKRFYNRSDCEHHEESRRHTYFEMDS